MFKVQKPEASDQRSKVPAAKAASQSPRGTVDAKGHKISVVDKNFKHGTAPDVKLADANIHPVNWDVYVWRRVGTIRKQTSAFDAKRLAMQKFYRDDKDSVIEVAQVGTVPRIQVVPGKK